MGGTAEAIRYTIGFDQKEAKESASKIHSLLDKMDKMIGALAKKAVVAKNKMMDAVKATTSFMTKVFQTFKDAMMKIFSPIIWLKDKFMAGFHGVHRLFQQIADIIRKIEGHWFSIHQRGLGFMRTLLGIGEEHKRHTKELESQDNWLKRMVDKAKEYSETMKGVALATPAIAMGASSSVETARLRGLIREGLREEFVNKLKYEAHRLSAETGMDPNSIVQSVASFGKRGFNEKELLELAKKSATYAHDFGVEVGVVDKQIIELRQNLGLTNEEIDRLYSGFKEGAKVGRASLSEMIEGLTSATELSKQFNIVDKDSIRNFIQNQGAITAAVANTEVQSIINGIAERAKAGFGADQQTQTLLNFIGLNPQTARKMIQSGNMAEFSSELMGGLKKIFEMGNENDQLDMIKLVLGDEEGTKLLTQVKTGMIDIEVVYERLRASFSKPFKKDALTTTEKWNAIWQSIVRIYKMIAEKLRPIYEAFVDVLYKGFTKLAAPGGPVEKLAVGIGYFATLFMALIKPVKWLGGVLMSFFIIPLTTFLVGKIFSGFKKNILERIFLPIAKVFYDIGNSAKIASTWVGVFFRGIGDFFTKMGGQGIFKTVWTFFSREFPTAAKSLRAFGGTLAWVGALVYEVFATIKRMGDLKAFQDLGKLFSFDTSITDKVKGFLGFVNKIWDALSGIGKLALPQFAFLSNWANKLLSSPELDKILGRVENIWKGIKGRFSMGFEAIKTMVISVFGTIKEKASQFAAPFVGFFDVIKTKLLEFWESMKRLGSTIKNWFKDTFGFDPTKFFSGANKFLNLFGNLEKEGAAIAEAERKKASPSVPVAGATQTTPVAPRVAPNTAPAPGQPLPGQFGRQISSSAMKYGIPPELLYSLVKQESNFNPNAVSGAGAAGLTQLMPGTAKDLGLSDQDRFNPGKNIDAGARYLSQMYKKFGTWELALAAYNAGPGNVQKAGNQIPNFAETQDYVSKISTNWQQMTSLPANNIDSYTKIARQDTPKTILEQEEVVTELVKIRALLEQQLTMVIGPAKVPGTPNRTPATGMINELATASM